MSLHPRGSFPITDRPYRARSFIDGGVNYQRYGLASCICNFIVYILGLKEDTKVFVLHCSQYVRLSKAVAPGMIT